MPEPILLGLIGRARSGKDTFARGLASRGYVRVAFADPLREMVAEIDPILGDFTGSLSGLGLAPVRLGEALRAAGGWEGLKDTPWAAESRRLLQYTGQAVRRVDPNFWLDAGLAKAYGAFEGGASGVVITDVRYRNEADAIREAGGHLIRIVRPGLDSTDTHASEIELDDYPADTTAHNRSTAEAFEALARAIEL